MRATGLPARSFFRAVDDDDDDCDSEDEFSDDKLVETMKMMSVIGEDDDVDKSEDVFPFN